MSTKSVIVRFKRDDSALYDAVEGSVMFDVLSKDPRFTRVGQKGESVAKQAPPKFAEMTKAELLSYAEDHSIEVNPKAKNVDIIALIEEAAAESDDQ